MFDAIRAAESTQDRLSPGLTGTDLDGARLDAMQPSRGGGGGNERLLVAQASSSPIHIELFPFRTIIRCVAVGLKTVTSSRMARRYYLLAVV